MKPGATWRTVEELLTPGSLGEEVETAECEVNPSKTHSKENTFNSRSGLICDERTTLSSIFFFSEKKDLSFAFSKLQQTHD